MLPFPTAFKIILSITVSFCMPYLISKVLNYLIAKVYERLYKVVTKA